MELKVRVVCRPEVMTGFELAGLRALGASDASSAAQQLRALAADRTVGVVLIESGLHAGLPRELVAKLERKGVPVIATFPSPRWDEKGAAEEVVLEILRRAIGYRVRAI